MTTIPAGLTQKEVSARLLRDGYNELPGQKRQNALNILLKIVKEPMLVLLIGAGSLYMVIGEPKDALILLSFVFVVVAITFIQERKTERTLEKLRGRLR